MTIYNYNTFTSHSRRRARQSREYRQQFETSDNRGGGKSNGPSALEERTIETQRFLEASAAAVRLYGWTRSRFDNQERNPDATWARALQIVNEREIATIALEDINLANDILHRWYINAEENEYMGKLHAVLHQEKLAPSDLGVAASAIIAYQRYQERAAAAKVSRHVGKVGERQMFSYLKVTNARIVNGAFASWLYTMEDEQGNRVKWFTGADLEVGKVYHGKATVKDHSEWGGVKDTLITRASLEILARCPVCEGAYGENKCTCVLVDEAPNFIADEFDILL